MSISNTQWHNRSGSFLLPDQLWDTGFCGSFKATVNTFRDPKSSWSFSPRSWLSCLCFRRRKNTRLKAFLAQSLRLRWTSQLRGTTDDARGVYLPTRLFRDSRDFPSGKHGALSWTPSTTTCQQYSQLWLFALFNTGIPGCISQELATWAWQFKRKIIWIQSMKNRSRNLLSRFMGKTTIHKTGTSSLISTNQLAFVAHPDNGQKQLLLHRDKAAKHQQQFVHGWCEHNSVGLHGTTDLADSWVWNCFQGAGGGMWEREKFDR